jgi:hypothetical protein
MPHTMQVKSQHKTQDKTHPRTQGKCSIKCKLNRSIKRKLKHSIKFKQKQNINAARQRIFLKHEYFMCFVNTLSFWVVHIHFKTPLKLVCIDIYSVWCPFISLLYASFMYTISEAVFTLSKHIFETKSIKTH